MKPIFMSLRIKMLLIILLRITIVYLVLFIWLYNFFTATSTRSLQADTETVLHSGSASLNGSNIAGLLAAPEIDTSDARYRAIADWFAQTRSYNPNAYPYIYYEPVPGKLVILADSLALENPDTQIAYHAGEQFSSRPATPLLQDLKGETLDLELRSGRLGSSVSGVTPLRDSHGTIVAALAVDMAPSEITQSQLTARSNLLPLLGLVYILLSVSVWFITGNLTRSVRALDQASKRIGEGDYTPIDAKPGLFPDEITHLTLTFNQMMEKVRGREETLRKQVEKLIIQVDEAKRRKDVAEVVESDFFQDLQVKARTLRQKDEDAG
jgi:HAMP domain-containing protein